MQIKNMHITQKYQAQTYLNAVTGVYAKIYLIRKRAPRGTSDNFHLKSLSARGDFSLKVSINVLSLFIAFNS